MNELVKINNIDLEVKEYNGKRVVTFKEIDIVHKRPDGTARKRFNDNKERFVEGEDYFNVQMSEKRTLGFDIPNRGLTLITESGYLMLVKSFTDDLAWEVQRQLVNTYFRACEIVQRVPDSYMIDDPVKRAERWIEEQREKQQLITTVAVQEQQIAELKPRADYTDKILHNKGLVTITQIAKDYGMSGNKLNEMLHDLGVQYKQSSQWLLYAKYQDKGYTHSETVNITRSDGRPDIKMNTKWTQKGRLFLYNLLKANDILPTIEKNMAC